MGILVIGIGVLEFLLIFAYPKPTPFMVMNIIFGISCVVGGILMLRNE